MGAKGVQGKQKDPPWAATSDIRGYANATFFVHSRARFVKRLIVFYLTHLTKKHGESWSSTNTLELIRIFSQLLCPEFELHIKSNISIIFVINMFCFVTFSYLASFAASLGPSPCQGETAWAPLVAPGLVVVAVWELLGALFASRGPRSAFWRCEWRCEWRCKLWWMTNLFLSFSH